MSDLLLPRSMRERLEQIGAFAAEAAPADLVAGFMIGSMTAGLGNAKSDIDVVLVTEEPIPRAVKHSAVVDGLLVDLEVHPLCAIQELAGVPSASPVSVANLDMYTKVAYRVDLPAISLVRRDPGLFKEFSVEQASRLQHRRYARSARILWAVADAVHDVEPALFGTLARRAVTCALEGEAARRGQPYPGRKWLLERLRRVGFDDATLARCADVLYADRSVERSSVSSLLDLCSAGVEDDDVPASWGWADGGPEVVELLGCHWAIAGGTVVRLTEGGAEQLAAVEHVSEPWCSDDLERLRMFADLLAWGAVSVEVGTDTPNRWSSFERIDHSTTSEGPQLVVERVRFPGGIPLDAFASLVGDLAGAISTAQLAIDDWLGAVYARQEFAARHAADQTSRCLSTISDRLDELGRCPVVGPRTDGAVVPPGPPARIPTHVAEIEHVRSFLEHADPRLFLVAKSDRMRCREMSDRYVEHTGAVDRLLAAANVRPRSTRMIQERW